MLDGNGCQMFRRWNGKSRGKKGGNYILPYKFSLYCQEKESSTGYNTVFPTTGKKALCLLYAMQFK